MKTQTKNLALASVLGAPFLIAAAPAANAASPIGNPVSIQLGAGWPTSSTTKDDTSSTGLHAGLSIDLPNPSLLSAGLGKPSIDLDYNTTSGHGNHVDTLGISYSERVKLLPVGVPTPKGGAVPYVGLGVGVFDDNVSKNTSKTTTIQVNTGSQITTSTTTTTSRESKTDWRLGAKLIAGVSVGQEFVEASYALSGNVNGIRTDSVNLALGVHF